jgi:hypothetical protein
LQIAISRRVDLIRPEHNHQTLNPGTDRSYDHNISFFTLCLLLTPNELILKNLADFSKYLAI